MRLGDFILSNTDAILGEWDEFARKIWPEAGATPEDLRDHAAEILRAAARDMQSDQTAAQQTKKSEGTGDHGRTGNGLDVASLDHAQGRATSGLSLPEVVAEYRALRATVIRRWINSESAPDHRDLADLTRFNETMDQSLAEAVRGYTLQVDQARRMFLAILAHDLRNPLNAMLISAEALSETPPLDPSPAEIGAQITASGTAMSRMLTDFLDFAQTQLGKAIPLTRLPTDLGMLCEEVAAESRAAYPERTIRVATRGDLTGQWDPGRLRQVLSNLVGNAIQHGAVEGAIELVAADVGSVVRFSVRNEGTQIPPDLLPRIFEPLSRGLSSEARKKGRAGSMGLGLYIAREVVTAHGGSITVDSKPGETTFSVSLPRHVSRPEVASKNPPRESTSHKEQPVDSRSRNASVQATHHKAEQAPRQIGQRPS